jgi:hypothetical protein
LEDPNMTLLEKAGLLFKRREEMHVTGQPVELGDGNRTKKRPLKRSTTRKPSCLISCSQPSPEGGHGADVGRHGAIKPAGRARERDNMRPAK